MEEEEEEDDDDDEKVPTTFETTLGRSKGRDMLVDCVRRRLPSLSSHLLPEKTKTAAHSLRSQ